MIEIDRELIVNAITYCGNQSIHHRLLLLLVFSEELENSSFDYGYPFLIRNLFM